jgi:hypothetical protein
MDFEHDFQNEVIDRLARIETNQTAELAGRQDHEVRLRTLEKRQWFLAGVAAVAGTLLGKIGLNIPASW